MHTRRVNKTKVTLRNAFIVNLLPLGSEKELKNDKRTLFRECPWSLDLSLNHLLSFLELKTKLIKFYSKF